MNTAEIIAIILVIAAVLLVVFFVLLHKQTRYITTTTHRSTTTTTVTTVYVIVNGYKLTNSNLATTLHNVSTLTITINSAPHKTYSIFYNVECITGISHYSKVIRTTTYVTTNDVGKATFTRTAPTYSYCNTTQTVVSIYGPGMSNYFIITVFNKNSG